MTDLNAELVHDTCHFLKKFDGEFKEKTLGRSVKWMIMHLMRHRELWGRGLVTAQLDTLQTQLEIIVISSPWNWLAVFTNVYLKPEHEHKDRQEFRNGSVCLRRAKKKDSNPVILNLLCLHENASERNDMHAAWVVHYSVLRPTYFPCCKAKQYFIILTAQW